MIGENVIRSRAALETLRGEYEAVARELAERLRPRLRAGEFSGRDNLNRPRWSALEAICGREPWPWGADPVLTFALAAPEVRSAVLRGAEADDWYRRAAMVVAWDVRAIAESEWGAPADDLWRIA